MRPLVLCLLLAACQPAIMAGGTGATGDAEDDPLAVPSALEEGSLDWLHREVVVRSCASTQGACHAGQFEPNLSTPSLFYLNLVNRPALEHPRQLRVVPGAPEQSLLVDKLRNRGVSTQMPLGAPPLPEETIALLEAWVRDGALRRPGAPPPERLNNPPIAPEVGVFDAAGQRLDGAGPVAVAPGTPLVLRHSVADFERDDEAIPFAGFFLFTSDGRQVVLAPGTMFPDFGAAAYDAAAPAGDADLLNWRFDWTVPATLTLRDEAGVTAEVPAAGLSLSVVPYYVDGDGPDALATFTFARELLEVK